MHTAELICTCSCQDKGPHAWHHTGCPMGEHVGSLKALVKRLREMDAHNHRSAKHWGQVAQVWEGKFHAVKRENNALRKKLYPNK